LCFFGSHRLNSPPNDRSLSLSPHSFAASSNKDLAPPPLSFSPAYHRFLPRALNPRSHYGRMEARFPDCEIARERQRTQTRKLTCSVTLARSSHSSCPSGRRSWCSGEVPAITRSPRFAALRTTLCPLPPPNDFLPFTSPFRGKTSRALRELSRAATSLYLPLVRTVRSEVQAGLEAFTSSSPDIEPLFPGGFKRFLGECCPRTLRPLPPYLTCSLVFPLHVSTITKFMWEDFNLLFPPHSYFHLVPSF